MRRELHIFLNFCIVFSTICLLPGVGITQPGTAKSDSSNIESKSKIQLNFKPEIKKSPAAAFWLSVIFPGTGQGYIGKKSSSYIFAGLELAFLGVMLYEHDRTRHYSVLMDRVEANQFYAAKDNYSRHYNRRRNLIWVNIAFWLYNATDAYVQAHMLNFDKPFDLDTNIRFDENKESTILYFALSYRF